MRLRDIHEWPTDPGKLSDSDDPFTLPVEGKLKACWYIHGHGGHRESDYLTLIVGVEDRDHFRVIRGYAEPRLRGIYAALRNHEGEVLARLGNLEVVDQADVWQVSF